MKTIVNEPQPNIWFPLDIFSGAKLNSFYYYYNVLIRMKAVSSVCGFGEVLQCVCVFVCVCVCVCVSSSISRGVTHYLETIRCVAVGLLR